MNKKAANFTIRACTKETNNSSSDSSKDNARNPISDQSQCKNKSKFN